MGFTKNWKDMLVCRVLLGLLEAGTQPNDTFRLS